MIDYLEIDKFVSEGAQWMDENRPGWYERINLDELDMRRGDRCILGQIDGLYETSLTKMFGTSESKPAKVWAVEKGFNNRYIISDAATRYHYTNNMEYWYALRKAWEVQVQDRLIADKA